MKISIGADHRGFALKEYLKNTISDITWIDAGAHDEQRSDYPLFAQKVCQDILLGSAQFGILICGSGVGMAIAANRYKKIYAAVCATPESAVGAKEVDGINVLVLPSNDLSNDQAIAIFKAWKLALFRGGRYAERLELVVSF